MKKMLLKHHQKGYFILFVFASMFLYLSLSGCLKEQNRRDIRGFYFPLEKLTEGKVYVYASVGNAGADRIYWYHRSFLNGEKKIFSLRLKKKKRSLNTIIIPLNFTSSYHYNKVN